MTIQDLTPALASGVRYLPLSGASRTYGLSVTALKSMARKGLLDFYRPTGVKALLVSVAELEALLASSRITATKEPSHADH